MADIHTKVTAYQRTRLVKQRQSGFSLLELILVIIIMSIMAVSLSKLTGDTVFSYIDAKDRNRLSQSSKWVIERITREAREALPQSVRTDISGNFHCIEFLPIVNASTYLDLPASGLVTSFNAVGYNLTTVSASLVAIMPIDPNSVYSAAGTLANVQSLTTSAIDPNQTLVTLSTPTTFSRRSPQNRFYLLNGPVSFCLNNANGQLLRYSGYAISTNQPLPPAGGSLIAENFSANSPVFTYQSGTLSRSGLLQINLHAQNRNRSLTGNSESMDIFHEVHIRNVP